MNKKYTIIGASGFIGSHLSDYLRRSQYIVNTPTREDEDVFSQDLGSVIYCAGMTSDFRSKPFETIDSHILLLRKLLETANFSSFLYLSSTRVYQGLMEAREESVVNINPIDSEHLYNLSKLTGESLCVSCGRERVRVVRLSNVVGTKLLAHENTFLGSLIASANKGHIHLESHPDSAKDYININDVIRYLTLISSSGKSSLYNVASGVQIKNIEWVKYIAKHYNCTYTTSVSSPINSFPAISVQRLQLEFGGLHVPIFDSFNK